MKKIGLLFLSLLAGASLLSCNASSPTTGEKLTVGMTCDNEPYNWEEGSGTSYTLEISNKSGSFVDGYDVQIAKRIGEELNKNIVVIKGTQSNLLSNLNEGTIDCIISDLNPTEEAAENYDFSSSYYESKLVLITKKEIADLYTTTLSKDELSPIVSGQKIGSQKNTPSYTCIDAFVENFSCVKSTETYYQYQNCIADILEGTLFAMTIEGKDVSALLKKSSDIGAIYFEQETVLGTYQKNFCLAAGVQKGNSELLTSLNSAIAKLTNEEKTAFMSEAIARTQGSKEETNVFQDMGYLLSKYWNFFLYGTLSTIILSVFGTIVGLFLGIFLAFGKRLKGNEKDNKVVKVLKKFVSILANIYSTIIRGTPMMVQAMIFKYGCQAMGVNWNLILPNNVIVNGWFIAGIVVITFNTAAYMGEIILSGMNGIDIGQNEGARSLGLTAGQTMRKVILPQAIRNCIPTIGNEWIVNVKDSSVLNVIGVTELYFQATTVAAKGYKFIATYIIIAIIYLLLTLCTTFILKMVENKLDGKLMKFKLKFPMFHFRNKEAH